MFGLSKKKKKVKIKKENKEPEVKLPAGQVHTMPAKFQITPKKGLSRKIKIIIIVVISLVIIGAGVVFFSIDWSQKSRQQLTSEADLNKNSNQISSEIDE